MNEKISVVIPTMNRPKDLEETLKSYVSGSLKPDEVIVVDQSSREELRQEVLAVIKRCRSKLNIHFHYQEKPSSTQARNAGLDLCSQEIIVFSDDDITVQKDTLKNIRELLAGSEQIAMIAGLDLNSLKPEKSVLGYLLGRKSWRKRKIGHVAKAVYGRFPIIDVRHEVETEWAMGFFFAVRRSLLEKWKLRWDENLTGYAYAEDLNFSYDYYLHAKAEGLRCIMDDQVSVWHRYSQEYRVPSRKATIMNVINREYISWRFFGSGSRIAVRWSNFGDFIFRLIRRENPGDVLYAQRICDKNLKLIKAGIIDPSWYE